MKTSFLARSSIIARVTRCGRQTIATSLHKIRFNTLPAITHTQDILLRATPTLLSTPLHSTSIFSTSRKLFSSITVSVFMNAPEHAQIFNNFITCPANYATKTNCLPKNLFQDSSNPVSRHSPQTWRTSAFSLTEGHNSRL